MATTSRHQLSPFADILCAVDGSRASGQAVRQAIALARPDAALCFMAVSHETGVGLAAMAELAEDRAQKALKRAAHLAQTVGISASVELRRGTPASNVLIAEAQAHDLMVLGSRGNSRTEGIFIGSVASKAAHVAAKPLLIARRSADGEDFPARLLLASDGSQGSWAAARITSRIARAHGSEVEIVYVPDRTDAKRRRAVSEQASEIQEAIGVEPVFAEEPGHVARRIVDAGQDARSSLIVLGHRGVTGVRALGSVSERVVHQARCSVLVVPPETGPK